MRKATAELILKDPDRFAHHDRVFLNNPVVMQGMGLAPLVVLATTAHNGVMLAAAVTLLLVPSRVLACLLSRLFPLNSENPAPEELQKKLLPRALVYSLSASVVYLAAYPILNAIFGTSLLSLGIYLPMLTVEPLLTYRFGRVQETLHKAVSKGLRITVGYALLLMLLGLCACSAQQTPAETTEPPAATNEAASTTETEEISTEPETTDAEAATRTITDGNGREVEIPQTVESIVCVGVGALRYSCYMQAQDLVVGVEDYETKAGMSRLYNYVNFDKFGTLPVTGTNGEPFVEEIIHVGPQVIVMSSYANVDPDELQSKTGIPVVMVPGSDTTLDDKAYETLRILGELYGKEDRAEELTTYLHGIEDDLAARTEGVAEEEKPSVYVCGVSFKGAHGFEGTEAFYGPFELIHANNLANTTGQTGAFDIDTEQVLAWDPDVIFVDFNGMDLIKEDYATNADFYNSLTAVKEGHVYSQISFRSSASNLETALADAYYGATILYPEQFADVDVEAKTGEIFEMLLGSNPYQDLKDAGYEFRPVTIGE